MKKIIEHLGNIRDVLDRETDTITDISVSLCDIRHRTESPESEQLKLAERVLDDVFEELANIFIEARELVNELSEIEANKDLPPAKKAH